MRTVLGLFVLLLFCTLCVAQHSSNYNYSNNQVFTRQLIGNHSNGTYNSEKEMYCGTNLRPQSVQSEMVSFTPEPGQYLRILILYVRFPDDDLAGDQMNGAAVCGTRNGINQNPYTGDNKFRPN
jgi:hypothetical protein